MGRKAPLFPLLSRITDRFAVVAIDMSLRSPGFALVSRSGPQSKMVWNFFAFGKKARQEVFPCGTSVELLDEKAMASGEDLDRYQNVIQPFLRKAILPLMQDRGFQSHEIQVAVESYAFPKRAQAGSNYKLHEICGILKYQLFNEYSIVNIGNVSPATWRSRVMIAGIDTPLSPDEEKETTAAAATNPRATTKKKSFTKVQRLQFRNDAKKSSFECFSRHFPLVDLLQVCNRKLGKDGNVPTPVQDIADAFCIALAVVRGYPGMNQLKPYPESLICNLQIANRISDSSPAVTANAVVHRDDKNDLGPTTSTELTPVTTKKRKREKELKGPRSNENETNSDGLNKKKKKKKTPRDLLGKTSLSSFVHLQRLAAAEKNHG